MSTKGKEVVLMMPLIKEEKEESVYYPSSGSGVLETVFPISIEQIKGIAEGFNGYNLDTIELHVTGVAETDGITKFFIGLSGEAGVKLVLKKNQ